MWNNRYLHIDSNEKSFNLYSKRTIFFEILNDKHVADLVKYVLFKTITNRLSNKKNPYSADIRMYFSHCYIIENSSTDKTLQMSAYTTRRILSYSSSLDFCLWNATIMLVILGFGIFYPGFVFPFFLTHSKFIKEVLFFGVSIVAFFISFASGITYLPQFTLYLHSLLFTSSLPGQKVIHESLLYAVLCIGFYGLFLISVLSFLLRLGLNYYHFAYQCLHYVPRVISTLGPYVCHYQEW